MSQKVTVLSYNVSFEAMTNRNHGSAGTLGAKCVPVSPGSRLTICAQNMANTIDKAASSLGVPDLDFVGLQEASRWGELQKAAKNSLSKMTAIGNVQGYTEIVTFYNNTKYKLSKAYARGYDKDRPFQITVFKNVFDSSGTIFINTHNPHGYPFNSMSTELTKAAQIMNLSDQEKKYRIIMTGDFNDTGWHELSTKGHITPWTPFSYKDSYGTQITYIDTKVSISNTPVYTCCQPDGNWDDGSGHIARGWRGGDYIFDSKTAANIQVPPGYTPLNLQSDHLPVVAVL